MSDLHAAIDIGTNSIHLVVARATPGGGFDVVTTEREMVRLGSGGGDMKRLEPAAMERGIASLRRMVEVASSFGADVTAVATSAVREAENRQEFVDRVEEDLGLTIDVISGVEEARLIHNGVIHALPVVEQRVLVVDIGGGSTEFIIGEGQELVEARSLRLGAIRLTQRFFDLDAENAPSAKAVKRCRSFLRDALAGVARDLGGHRPQVAIGSSGTITGMGAIIAADRAGEGDSSKPTSGFSFTADELDDAVQRIVSSSAEERRRMRGLDQKRVDIIIGGGLLLQEVFRAFDLDSMTLSGFALREGVLYDRFPASTEHLHDLRRSSALRFARQLDPDSSHAETVARLAVQIFDRTFDLHGLDGPERELLETAALVHNVGMVVSHSGHHKHAYYVVRNTDRLTGFAERDTEFVALIARYHRKSHPSIKHEEFDRLNEVDRRTVQVLAGILRIAIGLDRRHAALVSSVGVRSERGGDGPVLVFEPVVPTKADIGVELYSAKARSELLAEALDVEIDIRARVPAEGESL